MATFKISVFRHQQRMDGKYPVSIRVYWRRKYGYAGTEYYVTIHQIARNTQKGIFELKDTFIIGELTKRIELFEKEKIRLGTNIYKYSARQLARHFQDMIENRTEDDIDFLQFGFNYCETAKKKGKNTSRINTSLRALSDFCENHLPVRELTSKLLKKFEAHLRTERTISRKNQLGRTIKTTEKPLSDISIRGYMTDLRTLFNQILDTYNDRENGIITISHYPFESYKMPVAPVSRKRNIPPEDILKIAGATDAKLTVKRAIFARDTFLLSFIFIGMNYKDMYELKASDYQNGRLTYRRAKTRDRRTDGALISIHVEPEAEALIAKYRDPKGERLFDFYQRYASPGIFVSNANKGLKHIAKVCRIETALSTYYARHSWATIARNKCRVSKSDVDECLNHVDPNQKMADIYIEKDWSFIDEANRKVLDYVFGSDIRNNFVEQSRAKCDKSKKI